MSTLCKVLTNDLKHHDFQYKEGLNELKTTFNPYMDCGPGGLYFSNLNNIHFWIGLHENNTWISEVKLCEGSKIVKCKYKFKTDKLILKKPMLIKDFLKKYN